MTALGLLALAWLLGVAAAAFTGGDPWAAVAAASAFAAACFALRPRPATLALIAIAAALVFAAAWRYDSTAPPEAPVGIARHNDGPQLRFRAVVGDEPDARGASVRYRLAVREVYRAGDWRPESGSVLMRVAAVPRYEYGDLLEVRGTLEAPPDLEGFDYSEYLARQGIGSVIAYPRVRLLAHDRGNPLRAALADVRGGLRGAVEDALPEPEAALAEGILLGGSGRLPRDLSDDMNATGTSHLVAVSGQNVALLAGLLVAALAPLAGRRRAAWLALAAVAVYATLVGAEPSVVRAAIMGGLYLLAGALGRQNAGPQALALAAAAMTVWQPQAVHDVSFQLSFAATLGLMTFAQPLAAWGDALVSRLAGAGTAPALRPLTELAAVTAAAIAFTLPITAVNFHRISLVAPLANLLAVPAFLAVAVSASLAAAAALVVPAAGEVLGWAAWAPAAYMVAVVRLAAGLPAASVELNGIATGHAVAYYAALAALAWFVWRRKPALALSSPAVRPARALVPAAGAALVLGLASALLWLAISAPAPGRLTVTALDVGRGEAILIEGPHGHRILVDAGPSGEAISAALGRQLPFYDRRIDLLFITHPQADHAGGAAALLDRYDVGAVVVGRGEGGSSAYDALTETLRRREVAVREAAAGLTADLGGGARLYVLAAPGPSRDINESSVVLKLTMGRASFLLTGDIGQAGESALLRSSADLRATVYKVPHHGSATSSSPEFVAAVDPLVDVISVRPAGPYGPPAPETLDRLNGDAVFRTDLHGDVSISTDGRRLWVETAR